MKGSNTAPLRAECLPNAGLLVELGPQRRKKIAGLKRGDGALAQQIRGLVDQSRKQLGIDEATEIIPVVMIYRYGDPDYAVIL